MIRVEFHIHSIYSKDSLSKVEKIIRTCRARGINKIVITDHNTIDGACKARDLAPDLVIIGEEIMTTKGELLAAFVQEEIPQGLTPTEAIMRLQSQNAFISVSHPFDKLRSGHWEPNDLNEIIPLIDAIEIFNSRCMNPEFNTLAEEYALTHRLAGTVGSDAHTLREIGRAIMTMPEFNSVDGLRESIKHASYQTTLSSPFIHFSSRYAVWRKKINSRSEVNVNLD